MSNRMTLVSGLDLVKNGSNPTQASLASGSRLSPGIDLMVSG
jgi:hypothetical protein